MRKNPFVEHYPERQARPGRRTKISFNSGIPITTPDPAITNLTIYDLEGEPADNVWVEEFEDDSIVLEALDNMVLKLKVHPSEVVGRNSTGGVSSLSGIELNPILIIMVDAIGSLPTASVSYRGRLAVVKGGTGVTDTLYVCLKAVADTYDWISIITGG